MLDSSSLHARQQRPAVRRRTSAAAAGAFVALTTLLSAGTADAQFTRVSLAQDGSQPDNASFSHGLSANGRFVVFSSLAGNLVPGDTNGTSDVFVRDLVANSTERISVTSAGAQGSGSSGSGAISDDGTTVIFVSSSALVPEDSGDCVLAGANCNDLYAHDRTTHATTLLTRGLGGVPANGGTSEFQISADARFVVFASAASNLVPDDTNGQPDILSSTAPPM